MATLFKKVVKTQSKIDQVRKSVKIIAILNNLKISDTEAIIITHFILEGFNKVSREDIIKQKLLKSPNDLSNRISVLRSKGVFVKNKFKEELSQDFLKLKDCNDKLVLMMYLNNSEN
jgi:hypothetical protein